MAIDTQVKFVCCGVGVFQLLHIRRIKERNVETCQRLVLYQRMLPFITYFVLLLHLTYSDIG